jgi:hypothetical protein
MVARLGVVVVGKLPGRELELLTKSELLECERQCLAMADGATRETREALEVLASNYRAAAKTARSSVPASQMFSVLVCCAVVFAIYLPVALWLNRDYVPAETPTGELVELVAAWSVEPIGGYAYRARSFGLARYGDESPDQQRSPVVLYENLTPLGQARSAIADIKKTGLGRYAHVGEPARPVGWRFVIFSTSDNSDPRTNGRTYWLVLPK